MIDAPYARTDRVSDAGVVVTHRRWEVKMPVSPLLLGDVRAWVRVHPAHWRTAYPRRQINNIYFDSPGYQSLNANLGGIGDRAKLRLRWYGSRLEDVACAQLELKRKAGTAGWKEILPVGLEVDLSRTTWAEFGVLLGRVVRGRASKWLSDSPIPVLINCYQREYYVTPDGVLRLTIDDGLQAFNQRSGATPNLTRRVMMANRGVVELKAPDDAHAQQRLDDALSYFPISVNRFSKYVNGVGAATDFA